MCRLHPRRYCDDGSVATSDRSVDRHYAVRQDNKVSVVDWGRFLDLWSVDDLDSAARMVKVETVHDLDRAETKLLSILRNKYAHLLFLKPDDPFKLYQRQLRKLNALGILNLYIPPVEDDERSTWEVGVYIIRVWVSITARLSVSLTRPHTTHVLHIFTYSVRSVRSHLVSGKLTKRQNACSWPWNTRWSNWRVRDVNVRRVNVNYGSRSHRFKHLKPNTLTGSHPPTYCLCPRTVSMGHISLR